MKKLFVLSLVCFVFAMGCQFLGTLAPTAIPQKQPAPATPIMPSPTVAAVFSPTPLPPTLSVLPSATSPSTPISALPIAPAHLGLLSQDCSIDRSVKPIMYVNKFRLTWADMSNNEDGFRIYRDGDLVAQVAANVTNVIDVVSRRNPRAYSYYVSAYNKFGESKGDAKIFTCGK